MAVIKHIAETNEAGSSAALDALLEESSRATRRGIECLTCRVQARHLTAIHALEKHGFLLMDTLLHFLFDSTRTPLENINVPRPLNDFKLVWPKRLTCRRSSQSPKKCLRRISGAIIPTRKCRRRRGQRFMMNGCGSPLQAGQTGF